MRVPQYHRTAAWLLFAAVIGIYLLLIVRFPEAYIWATYEDMYGEWVQFYLFVTVTAVAAWLSWRGPGGYRLFFAMLAIAGFYTAGEEISWGQRLLGIDSPEFFAEYNIQGETNIHNFFTGPISSPTQDIVKAALAAGLLGYGVLFPLMLVLRVRPARWLTDRGLAAPPLYLAPFFVVAVPPELGMVRFNLQEVAEILVALAMLSTLLFYANNGRAPQETAWFRVADAASSRKIAAMTGVSAAVIVALAAVTTLTLYGDPEYRADMDQRRMSGMKKTAERYADLGGWRQVVELLEAVHKRSPDNPEVLRSLTQAYQMVGNTERYRESYRRLLQAERQRAPVLNAGSEANPVMVQLSVAEGLRRSGDQAGYDTYVRLANKVAISLAESQPDDAEAAYWLGRSWQQLGEYQRALKEYQRAQALAPDAVKYVSAYRMLARRVEPG